MNWNDYTAKATLKDNDELMILDKDSNANKRTLIDKIWDYVVDKMTTAVIAKLGTTDKTLIGAVNELNSNTCKDILNHKKEENNISSISVDVSEINTDGNGIPFLLILVDWSTGRCEITYGCYRGNNKTQIPYILDTGNKNVICDGVTLTATFSQVSYCKIIY